MIMNIRKNYRNGYVKMGYEEKTVGNRLDGSASN